MKIHKIIYSMVCIVIIGTVYQVHKENGACACGLNALDNCYLDSVPATHIDTQLAAHADLTPQVIEKIVEKSQLWREVQENARDTVVQFFRK